MKVSIIIPSYNESKTLPLILEKLTQLRTNLELIVVDDGSTDDTKKILEKFKKQNLKIIYNRSNIGKGGSIRKGLKFVTGDVVIIQDADLEYSPSDLPKIIELFKNKKILAVYGSRKLKNNPISHWTFDLGGKLLTALTNMLYGTQLSDEATGYKAFRKETIKSLKLKSNRFEFCPEVTAKLAKRKIKIHEVPISYNPRPTKEKKISWVDGLWSIFYLIKYRISD